MAKRRMGIIASLFFMCLFLMPCSAQAVSITDAAEPLVPETECALTLSYVRDGTAFANAPVNLYKIADVSAQAQYTLTPSFLPSGLVLNGIHSVGEWDVIRSTLESYVLSNAIMPDFSAVTNQAGQLSWTSLETGLYFVAAVDAVQNNLQCCFESALIALPGLNTNNRWQYQITVSPKSDVLPPVGPDGPGPSQEIQFKLLKLWKGDSGLTTRPQSIEAEIFKNGASYQTVTLSEANHWSYSWTVEDDGSNWIVVERNIPTGYSVTVEERGTTFILTNTYSQTPPSGGDEPTDPPPGGNEPEDPLPEEEPPESPPPGEKPEEPPLEDLFSDDTPLGGLFPSLPKTGDTSHTLLYVVLMYVSGIALVLLGITGKRKRV